MSYGLSVEIDKESFETINKLKSQLLAISNITANSVGGVLARTGFYGRERIVKVEQNIFNFGRAYSKTGQKNVRKHTQYDSRNGWIISGKRTKKGDPYRLVQYSFEGTRAMRSKAAFARSIRKAYVSSKMLNLWEHDTKPYSKKSPPIYYGDGAFAWQKGSIRKGRDFYTANYRAVEAAIPTAVARTEAEIQRQLDNATK